SATPVRVDHGHHTFPGWYRNTRRLLEDIGVEDQLVESDQLHFLCKPDAAWGQAALYTYYAPAATSVLHNLFCTLLPWPQAFLSFYFLLDLAAEPFSRRSTLDRISVGGLLRSRFYSNDTLASFQNQAVLIAAAAPVDELSAMTVQKVVKA